MERTSFNYSQAIRSKHQIERDGDLCPPTHRQWTELNDNNDSDDDDDDNNELGDGDDDQGRIEENQKRGVRSRKMRKALRGVPQETNV